MVRLCGSLAVEIKYLTDRVGSLKNLNLGFAGSLSGVLGPPHDLNRFDIVRDGEGLDGSESTLRNGSLHGVLGVGFPDIVLEGDQLLGAVEGRNLGTESARKFLGSSGRDLECLLSLRESKHSLERGLRSVFEVDVHGVQKTDGSFPEFDLSLKWASVRLENVLETFGLDRDVPGSDGATTFDALHGDIRGEHFESSRRSASRGTKLRRTSGLPRLSDIEGGGRLLSTVGNEGGSGGREEGGNCECELHFQVVTRVCILIQITIVC
mmetsp:Transcript_496/g.1092  ORF Transcript_496/g.1092 Transcript_496/m.1092 type:complete len:266 (-) Transcript_496:66-863(-)